MKRIAHTPRNNLNTIAEGYGFGFTVIDGKTYWDESKYYEFTLKQIEEDIEDPTNELHEMIMEAAGTVIESDELMRKFAIPEDSWGKIRASWKNDEPMLYGRMDLCYDGKSPAKLYEANYDTPTALFEAAVFQWDWLESQFPQADQFNSIHEKLVSGWNDVRDFYQTHDLHFACFKESVEDTFTVEYLMDTAFQAGFNVKLMDVSDIGVGTIKAKFGIGWDKTVFTDLDDEPIDLMFKLYPWECMLREEFGKHVGVLPTKFIEPVWKSVISNKAMMAQLWAMFPNHPNLIETYFLDDPKNVKEGFVVKPFFSREGAGVIIPGVDQTAEEEFHGGYIMQKYTPLPKFEESYPVIGSWVINGEAAGIGIREDDTLITKNTSRFVPHLIRG